MIYMFLGTGFEETEAIAPLDLLRRAGLEVKTVGLNGKVVYGGHGIGVEADLEIGQLDASDLEMVILPGGLGGVSSILACEKAMEVIRQAHEAGKYTAAICAGPTILAKLHITDNKNAACYPGCEDQMGSARMVTAAAVTDGTVITGTSAGCAIPFGLALIAAMKGQSAADAVAKQIVIR